MKHQLAILIVLTTCWTSPLWQQPPSARSSLRTRERFYLISDTLSSNSLVSQSLVNLMPNCTSSRVSCKMTVDPRCPAGSECEMVSMTFFESQKELQIKFKDCPVSQETFSISCKSKLECEQRLQRYGLPIFRCHHKNSHDGTYNSNRDDENCKCANSTPSSPAKRK